MIPPVVIKGLLKALPYILGVLLVCYVLNTIYNHIYDSGAASVQVKWDAQEQKRNNEILVLKGKLLHQQTIHQEETQRLSHELSEAQKHYDVLMDDLAADFRKRMLLSEKRISIYRGQAEGGAVECGNLAGHASKLDTTLEEGRSLVGELRTTLELRDTQIKGLGDQIVSDRKLFE